MPRLPAEPGVDRRELILAAALELFAEVGFDGATTKEIAKRAGVTQGLIYFYFPEGKEQLFSAIFERQASIALEQLGLDDIASADTPDVVVPRVLSRFIAVMSQPPYTNVMRLMARSAISEENSAQKGAQGRTRFKMLGRHIVDKLTEYLDTQVAQGTLRPVNTALIARLMMGSVMMMVSHQVADDESLPRFSSKELAASVSDVFLHGILTASREPTAVHRVKGAHLQTVKNLRVAKN